MAPHAYQLTSPRRVQVDRELLAALLERSGCQAARESYQAHVDGDSALRAGAHSLAAEYACPSCDLARALGVPERFATEAPGGEPQEGDQVVYVGPVDRGLEWASRPGSPGTVLSSPTRPGRQFLVWHPRDGTYSAILDHLRVVERASYTRVYEH